MQDYKDIGYRILSRVVSEGLWKRNNDKGEKLFETNERITNKERVVQIADEEIKKIEPKIKFEIPVYDELNQIAHKAVDNFINYCLKINLLNKDVVNLTGKLTLSSDIEIVEMKFKGGLNIDLRYDKSTFPKQDEERPRLLINESIVQGRMNKFLRLDESLSEEKLLELAVGSVAIHEWSHSIESAMAIQFIEIGRSSRDYDEKEDYFKVDNGGHGIIFNFAKNLAKPAFDNFQDYRDFNLVGMHLERFATGFEIIGFESMGNKNIQEKILEQRKTKLEEFKRLRQELNIIDFDLTYLAMDVKTVIKEASLESDDIPSIWQDLGYLTPYSREELKEMVDLSYKRLLDETQILEDLFGYKKK